LAISTIRSVSVMSRVWVASATATQALS